MICVPTRILLVTSFSWKQSTSKLPSNRTYLPPKRDWPCSSGFARHLCCTFLRCHSSFRTWCSRGRHSSHLGLLSSHLLEQIFVLKKRRESTYLSWYLSVVLSRIGGAACRKALWYHHLQRRALKVLYGKVTD